MQRSGMAAASLYSPTGKRKYLTQAERARFIAAALAHPRPDVGTLCLTLAYIGCRVSEALALTVGAVEREGGFVAVRTLKKRRGIIVVREIPAPPALLDRLDGVHKLSGQDGSAPLWTFSRSRTWQLVKSVMDAAGIPPGIHATPKGLRHGFGIHAIRSGVPINLVQRWLGHARIETTAIYLQAMGREERAFAALMWGEA